MLGVIAEGAMSGDADLAAGVDLTNVLASRYLVARVAVDRGNVENEPMMSTAEQKCTGTAA